MSEPPQGASLRIMTLVWYKKKTAYPGIGFRSPIPGGSSGEEGGLGDWWEVVSKGEKDPDTE